VADWSVHTYTAGESGLFVNSYLVETDEGVVVIDTNLLVSDIAAVQARLAALRKPLRAVFVTHAHPDHFNGVQALVAEHEVPVYATAGVAAVIREIAEAKRAQWGPVYGDEWPSVTYHPNTELTGGQQVIVDDLTISVDDLGAGESHADSVVRVRRPGGRELAFIGDVAFHGTHPYTADGHTAAWLANLDRLAADLAGADLLLPGHGGPTDGGVLADQRRYLLFYREMVRKLADGADRLDEPAKQELANAMSAFQPDAPLTWMIGLGADAVAAELAAEAGA
jgi:glyoxylase-like metal-dependent hydrolase (beta-lactamase superfamily II)